MDNQSPADHGASFGTVTPEEPSGLVSRSIVGWSTSATIVTAGTRRPAAWRDWLFDLLWLRRASGATATSNGVSMGRRARKARGATKTIETTYRDNWWILAKRVRPARRCRMDYSLDLSRPSKRLSIERSGHSDAADPPG